MVMVFIVVCNRIVGDDNFKQVRPVMRSSFLVFALNSTSAQWCVDTFSKRHAAMLPLEHCRPVISKTAHFRCCIVLDETCSMEWGHHGLSFKRVSHFHPNDPDLWPQVDLKLLGQLLLSWLTSPESLNIVLYSIFKLTVGIRDGVQTDRLTGVTRNAAS